MPALPSLQQHKTTVTSSLPRLSPVQRRWI